jgi:hypothetical protein
MSKHYERKMRTVLNKKLRTWEQSERLLLEAHGHYPDCSTIRSSIAYARVAPLEMEQESENYNYNHNYNNNNKMLRPGFEPGISDSKGRYA